MDLTLRNARLAGSEDRLVEIGVDAGRIVAIAGDLAAEGPSVDVGGRLVSPGLVETHIHLDKTRIIDRCTIRDGTLAEAVAETAAAKRAFTEEDIYERAQRTLEKSIAQGTMLIRTHAEIDPGIGFRGFDALRQLARDYDWAVDIELCVFPQEGLCNNPGTAELLAEALRRGADVLGGAPYTDSDPHGQIGRIFALARECDVDIDLHLDLGDTPDGMDIDHVCDQAERFGYGGRVAVGHMTRLSTAPAPRAAAVAQRLASAGVAVTVLPSTDLYLCGRHQEHSVLRGVVPAHKLIAAGVNCSLSTNNVLNPFTPYGDASLIRMANLYANVCHASSAEDLAECFAMVTTRAARLMRRSDYGIAAGHPADFVVFDCCDTKTAVAELAQPLCGWKRGRLTFTRPAASLHRPGAAAPLLSLEKLTPQALGAKGAMGPR
jgi:cytosine/creatinine deaminase